MAILRDLSIWYSFLNIFIMFQALYEPRVSRKKAVIISTSVMIPLIAANFALFLVLGYEGYGTLMLLTLTLPQGILYWILSKHRDGRFLFTLCLVDTIGLEIFYLTNIINYYTTPDSYIVMFCSRLVIYPLIAYWVFKKLRRQYIQVQRYVKKGWGLFALIGMLFYVSVTLLMTYPTFITNRPEYLLVLCLQFVLMPVTYIYIIKALDNQKRIFEMEEQDRVMRLEVSNVVDRMHELGELTDSFRKERHDFRHKLKAIASLVEVGEWEELARTVERYEDDIQRTQVVRYCSIPIIDAVLSSYIRQAKRSEIDVKIGIAFPDSFEADANSLATVIANAIENAIHACEKLPPEDRCIEIKVISEPKFIVMVRNSFNGQIELDEDGIPLSREEGHGFGSRSIAAFCKSIGGYCQFSVKEKTFSVYMHLK